VRSVSLSCPGCFATYEAAFAGDEPPAFHCRFCRTQLEEVAWQGTIACDEQAEGTEEQRLQVTQYPPGELRVWLDDDLEDRAAPEGWIHVATAWDAIDLLRTGQVVELSLDHDLGDDARNGRGTDVVDFLAEQQEVHGRSLWPRHGIRLHTANASGRDAMRRTIRRYAERGGIEVHESLSPGGKPAFRFGGRHTASPGSDRQ
jgi:hypothetical protein